MHVQIDCFFFSIRFLSFKVPLSLTHVYVTFNTASITLRETIITALYEALYTWIKYFSE